MAQNLQYFFLFLNHSVTSFAQCIGASVRFLHSLIHLFSFNLWIVNGLALYSAFSVYGHLPHSHTRSYTDGWCCIARCWPAHEATQHFKAPNDISHTHTHTDEEHLGFQYLKHFNMHLPITGWPTPNHSRPISQICDNDDRPITRPFFATSNSLKVREVGVFLFILADGAEKSDNCFVCDQS